MSAHDLARVIEPPVFGYRVWLCTCGHRSTDPYSHVLHLEGATA